MTTPQERMRSLRWGWELLTTLQVDAAVSSTCAERARLLLTTYPSPEALVHLLDSAARSLPSDYAQSIAAARELFQDVQADGRGAPQTLRDTIFTLRHFPTIGEATSAPGVQRSVRLERWLSKEQ